MQRIRTMTGTFVLASASIFWFSGDGASAQDIAASTNGAIVAGASIVDVPREQNPLGGGEDYYEVFQDTLAELPLTVLVGLYAPTGDKPTSLRSKGHTWYEQLVVDVKRDGVPVSGYALRPVVELVLMKESDALPKGDWREGRRNAEVIHGNESLQSFCTLVGPEGNILGAGVYNVTFRFRPEALEFFGQQVACNSEFLLRVRNRESGDEDRYTESLIQRNYLRGLWLYKFDRRTSKWQFEKAWDICWDYLRRGAGDEEDAWNITPRWQASLISGWLDRPKEEISYLSQLLSKHDTMIANGKECKMRYFHFGRERGQLPRNVKDDLGVKVNRLYERVYGKTMSGLDRPGQPPASKHFDDGH